MDQKILYDGWMKLYAVDYQGKTYEMLDNHDAVAAIVLDAEGKLLIVEQFRPILGIDTYELPAGVVDKPGLSLTEIMAEELMEEAELHIDPERLEEIIRFKPVVGFSKSEMTIFILQLTEVYENHTVSDCDVHFVHWMPFLLFEQWVFEGKIFDNKTVMAYYYLKSKQI